VWVGTTRNRISRHGEKENFKYKESKRRKGNEKNKRRGNENTKRITGEGIGGEGLRRTNKRMTSHTSLGGETPCVMKFGHGSSSLDSSQSSHTSL
jgi:hypothetical protein